MSESHRTRKLRAGAILGASLALSLATGTRPLGAATNSTLLSLTNPTANAHQYRHGAVPRRTVTPLSAATRSGSSQPIAAQSPLPGLLSYGGGLTRNGLVGAGVTTGQPQVYVVFIGSQWGTETFDSNGYAHFSNDPAGFAPVLQRLYAGFGTNGETWSGIETQYCDGVAVDATTCVMSQQRVPYPQSGVLAGVWYDASTNATNATAAGATGHQLAAEADAAAVFFANTDQLSNRNTQYVIVSPTGANPDGWADPTTGYCAYHDDTSDPTIMGGPASGPTAAFTNMPYVPDAGFSCGAGLVNTPGVLDGATEAASHEYGETITDQFPESSPAGGWTDVRGNENGDKCAYIVAPSPGAVYNLVLATGTFAVQGMWSNLANGGAGGCVQGEPVFTGAPTISSFAPLVAPVGATVSITGSNLQGATQVAFSSAPAMIVSDTATKIVVTVPAGLSPGPIAVTTPNGTASSATSFAVTAPTVRGFTKGAIGANITVAGTYLLGASAVSFNGTAATIVSDAKGRIVVTVPAGLVPGPISVTTPGGTATSVKLFIPRPTIASFDPPSGPPGTSVTISGAGLGGATSVIFRGRAGLITANTPTSIVVTVPARATTGPIRVHTAGGSTASATSFTVA